MLTFLACYLAIGSLIAFVAGSQFLSLSVVLTWPVFLLVAGALILADKTGWLDDA